ncbi:Hypothetical protein CINCED_3A017063 [Cinara cedri]|uniref:Uncharacterized protein n=1 Tax=Cinara cedri TaxID=506608 RepID=A0A5E4MYF3_9HEMI|nr:Hypothetical protein CINCED_3A017063 [Cinara cedri]
MADVPHRIVKLDRIYTNLDYLNITLPSDPDWQLSTYKKLVEKQRDMSKQEKEVDDPISIVSSLKSDRNTELWTNREVVLAAKVLSANNPKRHGIKFVSDNQMRRVYDIIFEVFRYRTIINEILNNIDFEDIYPNYKKMTLLVWLMSFDYYRNKFKPRKLDEKETAQSFESLKLLEIADVLKGIKIQLAASFSKFRIKHCALSLSDMLPKHLRNERFKKSPETIISCWINTFLTSVEYVITVLEKAGLTQMKNPEDVQIPETFKMDHFLPYFMHIYPKNKSVFLKNIPLFQKHLLILQVEIIRVSDRQSYIIELFLSREFICSSNN